MASILDLVKHYQHSIEKYSSDEQKVLKCIDKLYNLDVTVQHLQDTGVGRTVNALRKEPGDVGQAARALVYKWKVMVAAEESDQEGDIENDTTNHYGYEYRRDNDSIPPESRNRHDKPEKYDNKQKTEEKHHKQSNGDHSGSKRKYHSSEEEDPESKKSKYSSTKENKYIKPEVQVKKEPSDSELDSQEETSSDSDSEGSMSSDEARKSDIKIKIEKVEKTEKHGSSSTKQSSRNSNDTNKYEHSSASAKEHHRHNASQVRHSSEKSSKDRSNSSHSYKTSKEVDRSIVKKEKEHNSDKDKSHSDESSNRHRSSKESEKQKSSNSTEKHKSSTSSEKHKHSNSEKHKSSSSSEKHKSSSSEKHRSQSDKSSSNSEKHSSSKSDKDKHKSLSDKEISSDKHKSNEKNTSSSNKDKHSSSSKEKSKDKHSSSKEKESSHRSDKKHSSSKEVEVKTSDSKRKSDSNHNDASTKKSKHKSSSGSSKSSSSKSKEDIPKKKSKTNGEHINSDDGIDCGSGASFAEALGMISPAKTKKKSLTRDITQSPNSCSEDLSPATLLAPTAKLAPLPTLEISALPEISPNYRPRPPPKCLPHFTDENAMSVAISSKNQRTKVYSGNKVIGKITTLYDMCVQILQEHIDALEYTGGVPYEILKPVVDKATPQQLFMLEHYNPYLMEDTDHLWQKFCEKNFRNKKRQEYESWREMYMRCQEEQEIRLKSLTNNIRIAQEAKKAPIKQTKMAYVDSVVKPPRNVAKKQAQHGTAFAATASPAARVASLSAAPNVLKGGKAAPAPVLIPSTSALKPKKAPLMQKALQFMRGRKR